MGMKAMLQGSHLNGNSNVTGIARYGENLERLPQECGSICRDEWGFV